MGGGRLALCCQGRLERSWRFTAVAGLEGRPPNRRVVAAGLALLARRAGRLWRSSSARRQAALFGLGVALGLVLYHALFGFAGQLAGAGQRRPGRGPARPDGHAGAGQPAVPAGPRRGLPVRPSGARRRRAGRVSVLVGAFLFGVGMQFGGGCASGTLYTVGGGNTKMLATLLGFLAGSVLGTLHLPWWLGLPSLGAVSLQREIEPCRARWAFSWPSSRPSSSSSLANLEHRRHGALAHGPAPREGEAGLRRLFQGPWPLIAGGLLAGAAQFRRAFGRRPSLVGQLRLRALGRQARPVCGLDVAAWEFWTWPYPAKALGRQRLRRGHLADQLGHPAGRLPGRRSRRALRAPMAGAAPHRSCWLFWAAS